METRRVFNFTKAAIEALRPPEAGKRYVARDSRQPGLELLVTATKKSFSVRHRVRGLDRVEYVGLGQYPAVSVEVARDKARQVIGRHAGGVTHAEIVGKRKRDATTVADALVAFIEEGDRSRDHPLKPRTRDDYLKMIRPEGHAPNGRKHGAGELHAIASKRLDALTGSHLRTLHRDLEASSPTRAGYAMRVARAVLNFHGVRLVDDPFAAQTAKRDRIVIPAAKKRDRVIPPERLADWWDAASNARNGDAMQFMLITGLRRGEMSTLRCRQVDLVGRRIRLEDTKNRKSHVVMLSTQAFEIVRARMANKEPEDVLFDGAADPRKSLEGIIAETGIAFSAHDLRRTFGSLAAGRLPGYLVKAMLNHADAGDVTFAHYVRFDEGTMRDAWQAVADAIVPAPKRSSGKVVQLRGAKR